MKENVGLNVRHEIGVCAEQFGKLKLAYFRQLSCKHETVKHSNITVDHDRVMIPVTMHWRS